MDAFKAEIDAFGGQIIPVVSLQRVKFEPYMTIASLILAIVTYRVCVVIYRLYFHRLAGFPGPRLAASSTLYRAYYQCWKDGLMLEKETELHKIYGRVSPAAGLNS